MGCSYSLMGTIPMKKGVTAEAIEALHEGVGEGLYFNLDNLEVAIGDSMSYGCACAIDEALEAFAQKWASKAAVLHSECDGGRSTLVVGPDEVACAEAEIAHVETEAEEKVKQLKELRLNLARLKGEVPYGN
jgi:hypothetical protein